MSAALILFCASCTADDALAGANGSAEPVYHAAEAPDSAEDIADDMTQAPDTMEDTADNTARSPDVTEPIADNTAEVPTAARDSAVAGGTQSAAGGGMAAWAGTGNTKSPDDTVVVPTPYNATYTETENGITFLVLHDGAPVSGVLITYCAHAKEYELFAEITMLVGTTDESGRVNWATPKYGYHAFSAGKKSEGYKDYDIRISEEDLNTTIELEWAPRVP